MRKVNEMCAKVHWDLAKKEKRNIYDVIGKRPEDFPEVELVASAEEFCKLANLGCKRKPVLPGKAIVQAFTLKVDALALPGGLHRALYSEEMWKRKFMLTELDLLYITDGEENVCCRLAADFVDEDGEHHADVGCLLFHVKKGSNCFYITPWSMNVTLGANFADEETMCSIASLMANVWNGAQILISKYSHRMEKAMKGKKNHRKEPR